jgi:hypothetical protein
MKDTAEKLIEKTNENEEFEVPAKKTALRTCFCRSGGGGFRV